jgi:hypothetical protein
MSNFAESQAVSMTCGYGCGYHPVVRALAALFATLGTTGAFYATWRSSSSQPPRDLLWAFAAPVGLVVALAGAVMLFIPGFFSS